MTDRDELSTEEAEQATTDLKPTGTETGGEDIAGDGVASGEVRVVKKPQSQGNGALLLGVLLLIALIGGAFFLVNTQVTSRTPQLDVQGEEPSPKRYSIDKVEEEIVAEAQVAAVDVVAVAKQTVAVETEKSVVPAVAKNQAAVEPAAAEPAAMAKPVAAPAMAERVNATGPLYQVRVGPYLNVSDTQNAEKKLQEFGYPTKKIAGRGNVTMTRLLEGSYSAAIARAKLPQVKQLAGDAFLLPDGDKLSIYVGSFSDPVRAERYLQELAAKGLKVDLVNSTVEMNGRMIVVGEVDLAQARALAGKLKTAGFAAQVVRK